MVKKTNKPSANKEVSKFSFKEWNMNYIIPVILGTLIIPLGLQYFPPKNDFAKKIYDDNYTPLIKNVSDCKDTNEKYIESLSEYNSTSKIISQTYTKQNILAHGDNKEFGDQFVIIMKLWREQNEEQAKLRDETSKCRAAQSKQISEIYALLGITNKEIHSQTQDMARLTRQFNDDLSNLRGLHLEEMQSALLNVDEKKIVEIFTPQNMNLLIKTTTDKIELEKESYKFEFTIVESSISKIKSFLINKIT